MKVQILCTLGPSSLRPDVIAGLDERGVDLYRINLSHTPLEAVAPTIERIQPPALRHLHDVRPSLPAVVVPGPDEPREHGDTNHRGDANI